MWVHDTADDYRDLLYRLDFWLTQQGSAFGLAYAGTGDGRLTAYTGGSLSVAETFTITATSATSFDVVGSVTGSIGPATVGTPFSSNYLKFTIVAGSVAFVAGDEFTLSTAPKWTRERGESGALVTASAGNTGINAVQNVIDGKTSQGSSSRWWNAGTATSAWINFQFSTPKFVDRVVVIMASTGTNINAVLLDGWNGSSWDNLMNETGLTWSSDEKKTFVVPAHVASYDLYRVTFNGPSGTKSVAAVQLIDISNGNHDQAKSQAVWKAPGNDGESPWYCGVSAYYRDDVDYYNWELASFEGHNPDVPWREILGYHGDKVVPLWNDPIPYWFISTGRFAIVIAKVSSQYEMALMGLGDPFFTPNQWPLPMILGGCLALGEIYTSNSIFWNNTRHRFSNVTQDHNMPTHSDPQTAVSPLPSQYHLVVRSNDGTWDGVEAKLNDSQTSSPGSRGFIWPYRGNLNLLDPHEDGSYAIDPIVLITSDPNVVCKLPGLYCITGQGMSAETLKRYGAVDLLVIPNIFRVDREDWFAVRLD